MDIEIPYPTGRRFAAAGHVCHPFGPAEAKPAPWPAPPDKVLETLPEPKDYPEMPRVKSPGMSAKEIDDMIARNFKPADNFQADKQIEVARGYPEYAALRDVLDEALLQAACGKGYERHAKGLPFQEQRMLGISRLLDSERGMAYQACKKIAEGLDLPTTERKVAELLGAINYLAGIVVFLREKDGPK